jgi:hypothetical protein
MKYTYIFITILIFASSVLGQFNASVNGLAMIPQKEFKQNIENNGYGISASGFYKFINTPFAIGINAGWSRYGSETRTETLLWPVKVDVTTGNDIVFSQLFGRVEHDMGFIKPYAEIFIGFNYLFTNTEISDVDSYGLDDVASSTQFDDISYGYGFSFGSMFKIFECEKTDVILDKLYFNLKMSYAKGGETEYLKKGDLIRGSNNEIQFNKSKSELNYFTIQLGINVQFDSK